MEKMHQQIIEVIKRSENILIMPSSPPDGDSLGSALAFYLCLRKLGKYVTVVCADVIPESYKFLPMMNAIENEMTASPDFIVTLDCSKSKLGSIQSKVENDKVNIILTAKGGQFSADDISFNHGPSKYDLILTVDTASLQQLGRFYEDNIALFSQIPVINIDHHPSNENFGRINYVDIMASATTEMITALFEKMEEEFNMKLLDEDIATLLLAGIITDTGSFQNANTTPRSFATAAKLIRHGARQQEIIQNIFKTKQLSQLKLWGRILTNIKIEEPYRLVWTVITRKDFLDTGSKEDETGGIIDELLTNAPGTEVVVLLKEKDGKILSGSVRTTSDNIDASAIAAMFSGGGHVRAAGFKIKNADYESVGRMVIDKVKEFQAQRLNLQNTENQTEQQLIQGEKDSVQQVFKPQYASLENKKLEDQSSSHNKQKNTQEEFVGEETEDAGYSQPPVKNEVYKEQIVKIEPGVLYKFEE